MTGIAFLPHARSVTATFAARLAEAATATDAALEQLLARTGAPEKLTEAMRYAALSPGKRLRPFLLIESARLCGATGTAVIEAAAAVECVHAYSLVHDDLPAMDDDDFRRGRPTTHRAFGEATAILAGDALLTLAFETLARADLSPSIRAELVALLAHAAGAAGMVGGQHLDLAAEKAPAAEAEILRLQAMKTGALIRFACEAGAVIARASASDHSALVTFGEKLGAAFQLADDLLDATGTPASAGKATAKDAARGKATLVALAGIPAARTRLASLVEDATAALAPFGERADVLRHAARFVAERER